MSVCTFFGHRECPEKIKTVLKSTVEALIVNREVDVFYVGCQGQFDGYVRSVLRELAAQYPHIRYAVVLSSMPGEAEPEADYSDTMLPEGLEAVHPKFAIAWRNRWMLERADFAVTYIAHTWGGAYRWAEQARKRGKRIINLC